MARSLATDTTNAIGDEVTLMGWVNSRRDHGGLIFIDLRDESGLVQLTINPDVQDAFTVAEKVRDEYVLKAIGTVTEREEGLTNPNIATGGVEIVVNELIVLNKSEALPFQIDSDNVGEETRLKYRYLDLRRPKMLKMLKGRSRFNSIIHEYMHEKDFTEIMTPILANSSPEGARDYLVPSRLHPGTFYALPQAPQQFKQLLMVGGVPRYYQIAPCFRDEDPRADRHPGEFYQLDLEMAFVEHGEQVFEVMEPLIKRLVKEFGLHLMTEDVPRIPYQESMDRFGTDKPDLRYEMELTDLSDELKSTGFGVFKRAIDDGGVVKAICVKGGASLSRSQIDKFTDVAKSEGAGGLAYINIEGGAPKSPILKFFSDGEVDAIVTKMGAEDGDAIFFGSDKRKVVNKVLGRLRIEFADHFELKDPSIVALGWITDFPMYERDEKTGDIDIEHNPFSMPKGGMGAFNTDDPLTIMSDQYDMTANGYEVCSGAVRNHSPEIMYKVFGAMGHDQEYVDTNFAAMINAFKYGAPPHGGCAFGLDRLYMVLTNEPNIREVIAFPKNGSAVDAMTGAPMAATQNQLDELGITLTETE